jgi:hypothetical protein
MAEVDPTTAASPAPNARSRSPSVQEYMDLTGVDFNTAGSVLGTIRALEQASVKQGQPNRLKVDWDRLSASQAYKGDPLNTLRAVSGQLAGRLSPTGGGAGEPVGGYGNVQLRAREAAPGQPYVSAHVVDPNSGTVLTQAGLTPEGMSESLLRFGYSLPQEGINSLQQQLLDYYGASGYPIDPATGSGRGGQLYNTLSSVQPVEFSAPVTPSEYLMYQSGSVPNSNWSYVSDYFQDGGME